MVQRINQRPKAFIGAAISVGTQLIGGIIGGAKKRKAEKEAQLEQERQMKWNAAQQQASYMTANAANDNAVYADIRNQLMRVGGDSPRKGVAPAITRGGTAVPIKKNTFLLKGRKHDTGGIVIGKGKNSIEAEGEEVVQITPKQLKVFSAQPILNGNSPAELIQKGAEPSKVFNAQENFKDRNGLNDDGTKKKAMNRISKRKLGGLSRKDDYGSSKKPYPSVDKKDFAGSGRSYPIPTKADARDALRLAGLHGRSDVKAKVYKKYPELKKKKALLGIGTNRRLLALNQNVPSAGITAGANIQNPSVGELTSPVPATTSINNTSKLGNFLKSNSGELASSAIGAAGTLISGLMNKSSINKIKAPQAPQLVAPAQLKTTINVNPQLSDVRESELSQRNLIEGNTASSVASVARQQRLANSSLATRSKIRGEKENIETQLRNQDAMNRQGVAAQNAQTTNAYNAAVTQTNNEKVQALANNRTQMIEGLTAGVRDFQLGRDLRRRDDLAFAAELSKNPEQMELFMKLMQQNAGRIGQLGIRRLGGTSKLRCGGKRKVSK